MTQLGRREFIGLLGGVAAAAWSYRGIAPAAHAQGALPTIGFLNPLSPDSIGARLRGFHRGLKEAGYVEGENVTILYRWGEGRNERLPALAADLAGRQVSVIAALNTPSVPAAKAATTKIPIVFAVADDPVKLGFVVSLARPGGNATGVNFFNTELATKRLELLRTLVPAIDRLAVLVNPSRPAGETALQDVEAAAVAMGIRSLVFKVTTGREIDEAFATFAGMRPDALFVVNDGLFTDQRAHLVDLASRHRVPAIFHSREFSEVGGLLSYGTDIADAFRQAGVYTGRILKGERPEDLPVVQSTKFELVLNLKTARLLSLRVPDRLLALADEVLE
jgi:putative ABC transport system substrate-binding protein